MLTERTQRGLHPSRHSSRSPMPRAIRYAARCAIEALESRTLLAAGGSLDSSFDDDGKASINFGGGVSVFAQDVAVQADGKTVVVGTTNAGKDFAVARLNLDGTPDTTFGPNQNGKILTHVGGSNDYADAHAVAIQPDGKIVVAGGTAGNITVHFNFAVVRYNPDGSLDKTFDGDGKASVSFGTFSSAEANDVAIQNDGKIVLAGSDFGEISSEKDFAIARLTTGGSPDKTFNFTGQLGFGVGGADEIDAVALDYSGSAGSNPNYGTIVVAGTSTQGGTNRFAAARINTVGGLVKTFDGDGKLSAPFTGKSASANALVIQDDGSIILAGGASGDFALERFTANGVPDSSFGSGDVGAGQVILDLGGNEAALGIIPNAANTGFLVCGASVPQVAIVQITSSGFLDGAFGTGGVVKTSLTGSGAFGIARGPGKRFVVTGGANFGTARYLEEGANVVYATPLFDPQAFESGNDPASFYVFRSERLPTPTRVYFSVGGTARYPGGVIAAFRDYSMTNLTTPLLEVGTPYVDIPANETFTVATLTPNDDAVVEGIETAVFKIIPNSSYDVGTPQAATLFIHDNDGGSIAGNVFDDASGNGAKEASELGLGGRTVYIDANNNSKLDTGERSVTTDLFGDYRLSALLAGTYLVRQVVPSGWKQTTPAGNAGISATIALGDDLTIANFGQKLNVVSGNGSISGQVFNDANSNGNKDAGESGIGNVTVYNDANDNKTQDAGESSAISNATGNYTLANLPAGNYVIRQKLGTAFTQTKPANNLGIHVTLGAGQNATGQDFGDKLVIANQVGSIAGTVFNDLNGNGVKDANEPGLSGRTVFIDADNDKVFDAGEKSTTTNSSGAYTLGGLRVGTFKVRQVLPSGWTQTTPASNGSLSITLGAGQNSTNNKFGARQTNASIAGTVFHDFNRNKIKDSGDSGLGGWTVYIDSDNDGILDSTEKKTTTSSTGAYTFTGLAAGTYRVRIVKKTGYVQTTPTNNSSNNVTLTAGQKATGKNFGADN